MTGEQRAIDNGRPTLSRVADHAGVDPSTVSRVLRGDSRARVSEATQARIRESAAELGYVPNANARSLISSQTMTLGMLVPSISGLVYSDIIRGAEASAREAGYLLVVIDGSEYASASNAFHHLVLEGRVDGLLIASGVVTDALTDAVRAHSSRYVVLNRRIGAMQHSIIEDDEGGMRLAVNALVELGHRRIACLTGPADVDTARRRLLGYRSAMRAHGLPVPAGYALHGGFDEAAGYSGMRELLGSRVPPTAVAIASLTTAIGALSACDHAGVRVPDDLSVIAFHDAPVADYLHPALATVAMPVEELGRESVRVLLELLAGRVTPKLTKVTDPKPVLIPRRSMAPPAN